MFKEDYIKKEGNTCLREISKKVNFPLSSDDIKLASELFKYVFISSNEELVKQYKIRPGVGIAAPQVGVNKRMFAINFQDFLSENNDLYSYVVINPEIISKSKQLTYLPGGEGCLSVDKDTLSMITPRHLSITFKATIFEPMKNKIKNVTATLKGYPAIVFQHEYDHLDGILYTDKLFETLDCEPLYTFDDEGK
ncbi:MAG: peptide deformylase [Anaeroplasmataceae bacterium]